MRWWAVCAIAVLIAVGSLVGILSSRGPATVALATSPTTTTTIGAASTTTAPAVAHSIPESLTIPSIGVSTSVGVVGLQPDGEVMVPSTTRAVSWYRYGPTPGALGSAVILGHVDSLTGPGVFFLLRTLNAGALVHVRLADGASATFVVTGVVQYSKSDFPDKLVYGPHGQSLLNLVTCGGVFDHSTGHYESNIVVFTRLLSSTPSHSS